MTGFNGNLPGSFGAQKSGTKILLSAVDQQVVDCFQRDARHLKDCFDSYGENNKKLVSHVGMRDWCQKQFGPYN